MIDSLRTLYPQVVRTMGEEAFDAHGNIVTYDKDAVQAHANSFVYMSKRATEYPALSDQLDMLWHAINTNSLNQTSDFYTTIKAVKDKYPKS